MLLKYMVGVVLEGIVISGLGKGAVFMSIDYYKKEIKEKLGFDPYPGTLNLKIDKQQTTLLNKVNPIKIEGYKKDNRSSKNVHEGNGHY